MDPIAVDIAVGFGTDNKHNPWKQLKAASDCGNAMCEKYGMTIDHSIPCEEAFLMGVEGFGRKGELRTSELRTKRK